MREIKFRGYCKEELTGSQWITDGFGVCNIDYANGERDTFLTTPYGDYCVYEESVGQYTGLKDKNGKEIYEGDIIKSSCELYKVVFNRTSFKIQNLNHLNANLFLFEYLNFDIAEVMGNIYENPELLKG